MDSTGPGLKAKLLAITTIIVCAAGIDSDELLARKIERDLVVEAQARAMVPEQVMRPMFRAGFSARDVVSKTSKQPTGHHHGESVVARRKICDASSHSRRGGRGVIAITVPRQ